LLTFTTVACRRHCRSRPFRWKPLDYLAGPHLAVRILKSYITICDVGKGAALTDFSGGCAKQKSIFYLLGWRWHRPEINILLSITLYLNSMNLGISIREIKYALMHRHLLAAPL
jgi:hypothetical protein